MTNEPEIIVAELKLPVSVDTLAAIADALGAVHGKRVLPMRQEGALLRIFKTGAKEGEVVTDGFSKTLIKLQDSLARAEHQLDACRHQLDACSLAARGGKRLDSKMPNPQHGWLTALDDVLALKRDYENLLAGIS